MRGSILTWIRVMYGLGICFSVASCTVAPPSNDANGDGSGNDGGMVDNGSDDIQGKLAVFNDPDSDYSTSDVYDVDQQIVQFNTENDSIIWAETGGAFQTGLWTVEGNFPEGSMFFQVRFGTVDGQRRAYFTETVPATICDIRVSGAFLQIFPTNVPVPQEE